MIVLGRYLSTQGRVFTRRRVLRRRLIGLGVLMLVVGGVALAHAAAPAVLKSNLLVDSDYVTLGDLFTTDAFAALPDAGQVVIATAPLPGQSLALDAGRVRALAAQYGIDWPNAAGLSRIEINRTSRIVGAREVEDTLIGALAARGVTPKVSGAILRVRFSGPAPTLNVASNAPPTLAVDSLQFDDQTGQFRASLRAPADDPNAPVTILIGRAYEAVQVPVASRDIAPGERLSAQDFSFSEVPVERLGQNALTSVAGLEGMTPRRGLRAGQALRQGDVVAPVVVSKNELVRMVVRVNGMSLSAQGRALDEGSLNTAIRVLNTQSKRTVQATVTGPGEVTVSIGSGAQTLAAR